MLGESSAYAALGLEPGADAAAIDQAYRRLIKQHHPDREGGDAKRAAEINRAYRELKKKRSRSDFEKSTLDLNESPRALRDPMKSWVLAAMLVIGGVSALVLATGPIPPVGRSGSALPLAHVSPAPATATDPMDQPLAAAGIDSAVRDAYRVDRTSDEMKLAQTSQACHHQLRARPSLAQLDRCVAFDDAVVILQDRDPLRDRGPFSEPAVTGRQWSAASALSNDYLAIDGRLDRIRLQVETLLAPRLSGGSD
jgi:hypothetical protein